MCTWALVYLARTNTLKPDNYIPFFIAMAFDVAMIYWLASAIAGKAL